jgi:hypothetical protein
MYNLLRRATDICKRLDIDTSDLVQVSDIYERYGGKDDPFTTLVGTYLIYKNNDTLKLCVVLNSGWYKRYSVNGKVDTIFAIRDMKKNGFRIDTIATILSMTPEQVIEMGGFNGSKTLGKVEDSSAVHSEES